MAPIKLRQALTPVRQALIGRLREISAAALRTRHQFVTKNQAVIFLAGQYRAMRHGIPGNRGNVWNVYSATY
jgi:hypothetical protein